MTTRAITAFEEAVKADLFAETPDPTLREPYMLDAWVEALTRLVESIKGQYGAAKAAADKDAYELAAGIIDHKEIRARDKVRSSWKREAACVEQKAIIRLREAKALRAQRNRERSRTEDSLIRTLYRRAIEAHRATVMASGVEPGAHDRELWAVLDHRTGGAE